MVNIHFAFGEELLSIRELSPCQVVHGEDWVLVSGRVGDFARGEESFNFIPCF